MGCLRMWFWPSTINQNYPVSGIVLYKSGIEVIRSVHVNLCTPSGHIMKPSTGRKERPIVELSDKSLSRLAFVAQNTEVQFKSLMTLTYPFVYPSDGKAVKADLNKFLVYTNRRFGKYSYLWFLEFQRRGAPHIHILASLPVHQNDRAIFAHIWAIIATKQCPEDYSKVRQVHKRLRAWEEIRDPNGAIKYVTSYALKPYQKQVPKKYRNVGRFWGTSTDVTPEPIRTVPASEETVRALLKNTNHQTKNYDVIPKWIYGIREEK